METTKPEVKPLEKPQTKSVKTKTPKEKITKPKVSRNNLITNYMNETNVTEIGIDSETENANGNESPVSNFYKSCRDEKAETCGSNKNCHAVKRKLERELASLIEKDAQVEKAITTCLRICNKKDEEIDMLENRIGCRKDHKGTIMKKPKKVLFAKFEDSFTDDQLSTLRSVQKSPRGDSTFVLHAIRFSYSDDLRRLEKKTASGVSKKGLKEPITPQRLNRLKVMFSERLSDLGLGKVEVDAREKKFGRHVNRAIQNVCQRIGSKSTKLKIINVAATN